jgi:hypothetical protein
MSVTTDGAPNPRLASSRQEACADDSLAEAKLTENGVQQIVDGGLADHLS